MAKKKEKEIKCIVEVTEGADIRMTEALVNVYYKIKAGVIKGPVLPEKGAEDKPA